MERATSVIFSLSLPKLFPHSSLCSWIEFATSTPTVFGNLSTDILSLTLQQNFCHFIVVTVRNSTCGKMMFSQLCVKNSVQRGVVCTAPMGRHPLSRHTSYQKATAVDGTHPTGMLSCCK